MLDCSTYFSFVFGYFYLLCDCLQCSNFCAALYEEAHVQACRHTYLGSIKDKNCKNCKTASVYKVFTPWIVSEKFRKDSAVKKLITIEMRGALFCNFRNLRLKIENSKRMKYKISLVKKWKGRKISQTITVFSYHFKLKWRIWPVFDNWARRQQAVPNFFWVVVLN